MTDITRIMQRIAVFFFSSFFYYPNPLNMKSYIFLISHSDKLMSVPNLEWNYIWGQILLKIFSCRIYPWRVFASFNIKKGEKKTFLTKKYWFKRLLGVPYFMFDCHITIHMKIGHNMIFWHTTILGSVDNFYLLIYLQIYCIYKKSWPILCSKLLYKMGQDFLDLQ